MSTTNMPVSKAKTAYGLLSEIRKLILEEPKRYDQINVLTTRLHVKAFYGQDAPACGTVGCVGGLVTALKAPRAKLPIITAGKILGLSNMQLSQLVTSGAAGTRRHDLKGHAKRGAAHIARFQKKYAKQLKAKRV